MKTQIQSNSIRKDYLHEIADLTMDEIIKTMGPMLGPGATDAFIIKNDQPYYTRDGKEVLESLRFDNELATYFHHILYQAVHNQAETVGDGTTTTGLLYAYIYTAIRNFLNTPVGNRDKDATLFLQNINAIRKEWNRVIGQINEKLKEQAVPMDEEKLLSMLYTCTQDADLAIRLYRKLGDAIMQGAYIVPRKSNIATDLNVSVYSRPTFRAVKQFTLKPIPDDGELKNCVVLYCNGMLDIAHTKVLLAMAARMIVADVNDVNSSRLETNIILLCHGITDATRRTIRSFVKEISEEGWPMDQMNNIGIYTLTDYRTFSADEMEDLSTIITDEPGMGGLVQGITYETLLYKSFFDPEAMSCPPIEDLEHFDMDEHLIIKMQDIMLHSYSILFDSVHGMALEKELGPHAIQRYNELMEEIKTEKSVVNKLALNQRLRKTYGMFIDVEVGSALLKDSQRKFELILDAVLSASDGVKNGVLEGNSILHATQVIMNDDMIGQHEVGRVLYSSLLGVMGVLMHNYYADDLTALFGYICGRLKKPDEYAIKDFNFNGGDWWPKKKDAGHITIEVDDPDQPGEKVKISPQIMESAGIMINILKNSQLAMELAKTENFHISGNHGFMGNYLGGFDD